MSVSLLSKENLKKGIGTAKYKPILCLNRSVVSSKQSVLLYVRVRAKVRVRPNSF